LSRDQVFNSLSRLPTRTWQIANLLGQGDENPGRQRRNVQRLAVKKPIDKLERVLNAFGQHDAELGQLAADHVHQLSALPDQQIARAKQRHHRLLLGRLRGNEAHRRPRHRLADGRRIASVGLAAFDIGLHVSRRHQLDLMAQRRDLPRPEVARAAGFHADQTGLKSAEEWHHLAPA
jgi:hypothetical protein